MRLQLKFREDAPPAERDRLIGDLSSKGAATVRPLFPDSNDRLRGSLYVVDFNSGSEKKMLDYLNEADAVEFAEPEVRRKLLR